jgi:hypothetical protein
VKLTTRQQEVLAQASGPHGFYPHTVGERMTLESLWLKSLVVSLHIYDRQVSFSRRSSVARGSCAASSCRR